MVVFQGGIVVRGDAWPLDLLLSPCNTTPCTDRVRRHTHCEPFLPGCNLRQGGQGMSEWVECD